MEYKWIDTYTNNKTTVVNIPDFLSQIIGSLNLFLGKLKEAKPEIQTKFTDRLEKRLYFLISEPYMDFYLNIPGLEEKIRELTNLEKLYFIYGFQFLGIPSEYSSEIFETTWYASDKAFLFPSYHRALVLCEILGRKEAIEYLKEYIDSVHYERAEPDLDLKDLEYIWEYEDKEDEHPSYGIGFRMNKGKIGFRVDKCVNYDVLKEVKDPELTHIICCYGDTAMFESKNPNFAYTMPKTLMKGDPYCDKCFHDKRHVEKVEHPPEEFWESLKPIEDK